MNKDLYNTISVARTIDPIVGNDDTEGTGVGVDLRGYESALVVYYYGISGDTLSGSVKVQAVLEESVDNSVWTAVAAADIQGTLPLIDDPAEDPAIWMVGYMGTKRYLRARNDFTGTHTNGFPMSALIIRGHARVSPVAQGT